MKALLHDLPSLLIGLAAVLIVCDRLLSFPSTADRRAALIVLMGLTVIDLAFRTTCRYWDGEIAFPFFVDPGQQTVAVESVVLRGDIILKAQGIPIMERAGATVMGPTAPQERRSRY